MINFIITITITIGNTSDDRKSVSRRPLSQQSLEAVVFGEEMVKSLNISEQVDILSLLYMYHYCSSTVLD